MHTIYVLKSGLDGNLYIGCTSDMQRRIIQHESGKVLSTKYRRPLSIVYRELFTDKYEAYKMERFYKTAVGKRILKKKIYHQSCGIV